MSARNARARNTLQRLQRLLRGVDLIASTSVPHLKAISWTPAKYLAATPLEAFLPASKRASKKAIITTSMGIAGHVRSPRLLIDVHELAEPWQPGGGENSSRSVP